MSVRPTTDFAREALFNILNNNFDFEEIRVLDLFAGTGCISYEFGSRGCPFVRAVDINHKQIQFIESTSARMEFVNFRAIQSDAFKFLKNTTEKYDIIFADPPYDMDGFEKIPQLVFERQLLLEDGWLILEHGERNSFADHERFKELRKYGQVHFSIFAENETK